MERERRGGGGGLEKEEWRPRFSEGGRPAALGEGDGRRLMIFFKESKRRRGWILGLEILLL